MEGEGEGEGECHERRRKEKASPYVEGLWTACEALV